MIDEDVPQSDCKRIAELQVELQVWLNIGEHWAIRCKSKEVQYAAALAGNQQSKGEVENAHHL